jgi:hypothetical protein
LFVTLIPEGPNLIIDLSKEVNNIQTSGNDPELLSLTNQLLKITYQGKVIIDPNSNDSIDDLKVKINKATLLKDILNHSKNTPSDN